MMAENYTYSRPNQVVKEMVRRGEFGKTYYAEGEYLHEVKGLNERTPWRRTWHTGVDGVTYGTHSLGPILQWMPGDRVERVCAAGSGRHHADPRGDVYENQATCLMLCQMRSGGLVKVRLDMLSDRPHSLTNYQLQAHGRLLRVVTRARRAQPRLAAVAGRGERWRRPVRGPAPRVDGPG